MKLDTLPLHTTDVMRVQLIKRPTNKVKYLVIRVLSYNDEEIDTLITMNDVQKLASVDAKNTNSCNDALRQTDLFNQQ